MEENILGLVKSEGPRPSAGLSLTAQQLLCHQLNMMTWMTWVTLMTWRTLMILMVKVHLVLLVVLVKAELWATISIGQMEMTSIGEMKMPQLVARCCYMLIGTQALLHI